jgi:hypothetical protein
MKIIKLTESDLTNIVKRVIKENSMKDGLINTIKEEGVKSASELVGGSKNLIKILKIDTPMDYLNLFNDLDVVQSETNPDWTLFRYNLNNNFMVYDRKNEDVYVSYDDIWSILKDNFGLTDRDTWKLMNVWLGEVYNIRGVTPQFDGIGTFLSWVRFTI